jgi:hypothetical protein
VRHNVYTHTIIDTIIHHILNIYTKNAYLSYDIYIYTNTGALRDLIILLDVNGNFIGSNRVVEELLGFPETHPTHPKHPYHPHSTQPTANSNGSQMPQPPCTPIVDGTHYTEWMSNGNSPELCRDIALALKQKKVRHNVSQ